MDEEKEDQGGILGFLGRCSVPTKRVGSSCSSCGSWDGNQATTGA